ncbi:hypothetical protein KIN20_004959 [Parelaphostrongylus tenuis]|uniref:Coiled-coil domain-containing protein n=1 Tax=Parelaphostrongylus tenuis TaxID=148309 RepID=A0AAD5LZA6_PARTN|nr:hypothetical protein KIN20_004959 [Parelaphostrongylus tenuis]
MEGNLSFAEVRQRLREIEDQSMASRLQEEEFNKYYNHNRKYRRMVGEDTKHSIREQANEDEFARRERVETVQKIAESDKEIARRLQQQIEEEERERLELQVRMDAELAKALSVNEEFQNTNSSAREISSSQLHNHSPPTSSTFGYLSSNNESCKGSTSPSATNFYESLRAQRR